jgi:membrane protein implicated in regulation of membrane protease activity
MKPSGAHTHPEMGGGGGNGWLVIFGAIALATIAGPAAHAIRDLIMVLAITVAAVVAVAATAAVLTYRARHRDTRTLTQRDMRALPTPGQQALGRAQEIHLHFHGVSAEDVAAIIAWQDEAGE